MAEVCHWKQEDDFDASDCWNSDCGHAFCLNEGAQPEEHGMKFCCFCGKPLVGVLFVPEPDEEEDE